MYIHVYTCTYPYRSGDSGVTFTIINSRIGSGTLRLDPSIRVSPENYKTVSQV